MKGFSLIELLLSLSIAALILLLLIPYYFISQQQYFLDQKSLEDGLEVYTLIEFMRDSIRRAGFSPCLSLSNLESFDHLSQSPISALKVERESFKTIRMSENFYQAKILNSDSLLIEKIPKDWAKGFPLLIADCFHAEIVKLNSREEQSQKGTILKLNSPLKYEYTEELYLGEAISEVFLIEKHKGIESLYYQTVSKERLSTKIKALRVKRINSSLIRLSLEDAKKKSYIFFARRRA